MISNTDLFVSAYILAAVTSLMLSASKPALETLQYWFGLVFVVTRRRWKRRGVAAAPLWAFASAIGVILDIVRSSLLAVALARYYGIRKGLNWPGVQLQPLRGPDRAPHLIVVVPGTWHNPRSIEFGKLRDIVAAIGDANPQAQVVLARWPSWNKQSARRRAASELADHVKYKISGGGITVSFVGHSHGGTVAAAAAAQLGAASLGRVVTLGSPLIVDPPTTSKRGTGDTSKWPFAALIIGLAGVASFLATTLVQGPFPGLTNLRLILIFEGTWAALFVAMVVASLFLFDRASKRISSSMAYATGSKVAAIYATEDLLIKGLLAAELLRRSSDATSRKLERLARKRYEPKSFLKMHAQAAIQLCCCLLSPLLMFYLLPLHRTQEFEYVVVLTGTIAISAVVTHVFPNPYFEWMAASFAEMLAALIRGSFALTRLALCGVEVTSLPFRTFAVAKPGLHGEDVRMIRTGYGTLSAHSKMLTHPDVVKTVAQVFTIAT